MDRSLLGITFISIAAIGAIIEKGKSKINQATKRDTPARMRQNAKKKKLKCLKPLVAGPRAREASGKNPEIITKMEIWEKTYTKPPRAGPAAAPAPRALSKSND